MAAWRRGAARARTFLHAEFMAAGVLFLLAAAALVEALFSGWHGGVVAAVVGAAFGALVWRKGLARWVWPDTDARREAWITTALRATLSRAGVPHRLGVSIRPSEYGMAFFADALVEGSAKRGIIVTDAMLQWDTRDPRAQEMLRILCAMREASESGAAVLWLPYARPARMLDRLITRRRGVRVVFGGPWRLRKMVMAWHPMLASARRQAAALRAFRTE